MLNGRKILWGRQWIFTVFLMVQSVCLLASPNYYYQAIDRSTYQNSEEINQEIQAQKIETFLQKTVPGLTVTYRDVIDVLIDEGLHVYLRGGVIRDLLSQSSSSPNDVDLDYTGDMEEMMAICEEHGWRYTYTPKENKKLVVIGDYENGGMDTMPVNFDEEYTGDRALEFTINNIFYHCNTGSFLKGSEIGLQDLSFDRLNIVADDWQEWLYGPKYRPYYKIFRFWKMVGKGYVYSTKLQNFFQGETQKVLSEDPDKFREEIVHYLSGHFYSFNDVYHGAIAIMGYEWAQKNVMFLRETAIKQEKKLQHVKEKNTYQP